MKQDAYLLAISLEATKLLIADALRFNRVAAIRLCREAQNIRRQLRELGA